MYDSKKVKMVLNNLLKLNKEQVQGPYIFIKLNIRVSIYNGISVKFCYYLCDRYLKNPEFM